MDWFERLTGFRETNYDDTRRRLEVCDGRLRSVVNGKSYAIGALELVSVQTLRERVQAGGGLPGRIKVQVVNGDVRRLHQSPEYAGALFQVASQFNLLEMVSPGVTPELGVTRYQDDLTQGPACAIAAGAATIYRNYFVPIGDHSGQTRERQLNALADLGSALSQSLEMPIESLWTMRNGYAMCTQAGLEAIARHLESLTPQQTDSLRGLLRIGVHRDVEVTDGVDGVRLPVVSQAFCSALPVAYTRVPRHIWKSFAALMLESAYEATLCAGVENAQRGNSNILLLTRLGGGAFGNDDDWIDAAMRRAIQNAADFDLDVKLVSYGSPSPATLRLASDFG
jgi:hypothetical protein